MKREIKDPVAAFVAKTIAMLDKDNSSYSKASLAKLRRAAGKSVDECPEVWDITLMNAPESGQSKDIIHTVLTLYALHKQGKDVSMCDDKTGFGTAIAKLIEPDKNNEDSIRRRFNLVATSQEFSELAYHARGLVQMLRAKGIHLDYIRFTMDLNLFLHPDYAGKIRLKWGEQFYGYVSDEGETSETNSTKGDDL